jgi:hypothetical protein
MRSQRLHATYTINLELPEEERWSEVIRRERTLARGLIKEALAMVKDFPKFFRKPVKTLYRIVGGRYTGEMQAWAHALRVGEEDFLLTQCSYELSHLPESDGVFSGTLKEGKKAYDFLRSLRKKVLGCTSGIKHARGHGMVHLRSLDWPLKKGAKATRIFRFIDGDREFIAVGMVGMVGVLSGMVTGGYSATINHAQPDTDPDITALGPLFLLREVLETCDTYEEAVYMLKHSPVSTHVFFTVCGIKAGQACTIERGKKNASIRKHGRGTHAQGNLYINRPFKHLNAKAHNLTEEQEEEGDWISLFDDSTARVEKMESELKSFTPTKDLASFGSVLRKDPIRSDTTIHQIVFRPRTGDLCVWAVLSD